MVFIAISDSSLRSFGTVFRTHQTYLPRYDCHVLRCGIRRILSCAYASEANSENVNHTPPYQVRFRNLRFTTLHWVLLSDGAARGHASAAGIASTIGSPLISIGCQVSVDEGIRGSAPLLRAPYPLLQIRRKIARGSKLKRQLDPEGVSATSDWPIRGLR